jgi:alkanesulfonate monooxygenase SsuD/methylene tetrahydromethanopterin reductase-like flavin-dependent oxidoreductase (luciferase family)
MDAYWSPAERAMVERSLAVSFVGSPDTVRRGLAAFIEDLRPDELMITAHIHDQPARLRSIELVAGVRDALGTPGRDGNDARRMPGSVPR